MPTYSYECSNCQHKLSELQTMSEKPLRRCPKCNKRKLVRQIGAGAGIHFRGFWPGKRIKEVDSRKKRQENRLAEMMKKKEITKPEIDQMFRITKKYAKASPYLHDPSKSKPDPKTFDETIEYNSKNPLPEPKFDGFDSKKSKKNRSTKRKGS